LYEDILVTAEQTWNVGEVERAKHVLEGGIKEYPEQIGLCIGTKQRRRSGISGTYSNGCNITD
jgi:hypothetical protein